MLQQIARLWRQKPTVQAQLGEKQSRKVTQTYVPAGRVSRKVTQSHAKSRKVTQSYAKLRKVTQSYAKLRKYKCCLKTLIITTKKVTQSYAKLRGTTVPSKSAPDRILSNKTPPIADLFHRGRSREVPVLLRGPSINIADTNEICRRILYPSSSSLSVFPPCCPVFLPCCRGRSRHSVIRQWSRRTVLGLARRLRQPILSKKPLVQRLVGT